MARSMDHLNTSSASSKQGFMSRFLRESAGLRLMGQYFTPRNIVQAMVKMSPANSLTDGASLCDPFCGVGGFLLEAIKESPSLSEQYTPHNGLIAPNIRVVGYDKGGNEKEDERTIILAKANTIIYFSDLIEKYNAQTFLKEFTQKVVNQIFNLPTHQLGHIQDGWRPKTRSHSYQPALRHQRLPAA